MTNLNNYKLVENLIALIYTNDIYNFGEKSFYPQILKTVSSVNLRQFTDEELNCEDDTFSKKSLGASINSVARSLRLPRETVRRKISELIELKWLFRSNSQIYVSKNWRIKNLQNSETLIRKIKSISENF